MSGNKSWEQRAQQPWRGLGPTVLPYFTGPRSLPGGWSCRPLLCSPPEVLHTLAEGRGIGIFESDE